MKLINQFIWLILLKVGLSQKWKVTVSHEGQDSVQLSPGVFSEIMIKFDNKPSENPIDLKGSLLLSDSSIYHLSSGEIIFDTSSSLSYETYIGITCNADPSGVDKQTTLTLITKDSEQYVDSTPFQIQYSFNRELKFVQFSISNSYVAFSLLESFSLKEVLFNVDPLIIQFKSEPTNSEYAYINSTIFINQFPFPTDFMGRYGLTQFDYIVYSQTFSPVIESKCYKTDDKIIFSLNQDGIQELNQKVKEDLKKTQLMSPSSDSTIKFNVPISVVPSILSCAVFCVPIVDLSDSDIRNKAQKDYKATNLQYYQQFYYTKTDSQLIGVPQFKGLSRLCPLRMKCLLDVNEEIVLIKTNFKSSSVVFGRTKLADIREQIYGNAHSLTTTNCGNWFFVDIINKEPFNSKAVEYCNKSLKSDKGCIECEYRENVNEKIASICVRPDEACPSNYDGIMAEKFKAFADKISTGKGIKDELGLDEVEYSVLSIQIESDSTPIEDESITSIIKEKTIDKVVLEITNKNKRPIECYPRLLNRDTYLDIYEEEFLNDKMKGVIESESKATFSVLYETEGIVESMYNIYINCLNLPNYQHYFHSDYKIIASFYLPFIPLPQPTLEPLPDCKKDMKKPQCKITSKIFPANIENILTEMDEYKTYRRLSQSDQFNIIYEATLSLEEKSREDLIRLALMFDYMSDFNCLKYSNYTECRYTKSYSSIAIFKNIKLKYSNVFFNESMSELRYYYSFVLYYLSLNSDSLSQETGDEFIELVFKYIDQYKSILWDDSKILLLFGGIMNNIIDLVDYMYIDGFITENPSSEISQMFTNSTLKKNIKNHIEDLMILFKEIGLIASYSNFIYTVHQLDKESQLTSEFINVGLQSINVTIPSKELIEIKKVNYISSIVYLNYPLSGYNNSKVWNEVLTMKAYDDNSQLIAVSKLKERIKIRYNNLKINNTHLVYCGFLNEDKWDIDNEGMFESEYETKALICETEHLTDFLVKDSTKKSLAFLWWAIPLSVIVLVIISLGLYYLIKMYSNKTKDTVSLLNDNKIIENNRIIG